MWRDGWGREEMYPERAPELWGTVDTGEQTRCSSTRAVLKAHDWSEYSRCCIRQLKPNVYHIYRAQTTFLELRVICWVPESRFPGRAKKCQVSLCSSVICFPGTCGVETAVTWWRKGKSTERPTGNLNHLEVLRIFASLTLLINSVLIRNLFLLEFLSWKCF